MIETYAAVGAAMFSAIAGVFAPIATWRSPIAAARLAEELRRKAQREDEKLRLFTTLMQERTRIDAYDAVRALNLIDVVFSTSGTVRDAWAQLLAGLTSATQVPPHVTQERLQKLLAAMAADLGLAEQLRVDDFSRSYFPTSLQQSWFIQDMQRKQALQNLQSQPPEANAGTPTVWPPRPAA